MGSFKYFVISTALILLTNNGAFGTEWTPQTSFKCGIYRATGRWFMNSQSQFILAAQAGSRQHSELVVVGGDFKEKFGHTNQKATIEFYVPKAFTGQADPVVFLQKFIEGHDSKAEDGYELVKIESCGQAKRFVQ